MDDLQLAYLNELSKDPHNSGTLDNPSISSEDSNPLCGDRVRIDLLVQNGIITDVRFKGRGCSISQASASLLTDEIKGMSVEAAKLFKKEELLDLIGIPLDKSPVRLKCALLSLKVLKAGLYGVGSSDIDEEDF
jgi:nitrogen fixation protein NifU and related proteins